MNDELLASTAEGGGASLGIIDANSSFQDVHRALNNARANGVLLGGTKGTGTGGRVTPVGEAEQSAAVAEVLQRFKKDKGGVA